MGYSTGFEAREQAAVELQVSCEPLLSVCCAERAAAGAPIIRPAELRVLAAVDRVGGFNGDEKLTSQFDVKSNEMKFYN